MSNPENMEIENHILEERTENMPSTSRDTEDLPSSSSSGFNTSITDGWTKDELHQLYLSIKHRGSKNVKAIQKQIPRKSLHEIEQLIENFREMARENPEPMKASLKMKKAKTKPLVPLSSWAKLLKDNFSPNELQTEMVTVFRLIADLDDIPPPELTANIDFRKIYHLIADAMEGKEPTEPIDPLIAQVLHSCISDTISLSKQFINVTTFKNVVNGINVKDKSLAVLRRPTKDFERHLIRHFASQVNYNPLGIPEENLFPMSSETVAQPE